MDIRIKWSGLHCNQDCKGHKRSHSTPSASPRVVRSKERAPVNVPFLSQRHPSYRGYSTVAMEKAYEAAVAGTSVRKAAEEYGIPRSTLQEKVNGECGSAGKKRLKELPD